MLVRKSEKGEAELVLLDHGLYQQVPQKDRIALSHLWKAIVFNDRVKMKKYSNDLGVESIITCVSCCFEDDFYCKLIFQIMSYLLKF